MKMIPLAITTESPPVAVVPKPANKIKIGQVQLNNSFSGQCYFPLSVGMLQAYAQEHFPHPDCLEFLLPIFNFEPINNVVDRLDDADLLLLSLYVWNFENSMAIAREFKRRYPDRFIIVGGPHVPDSKKQFQRIKKSDPKPDDLRRKRAGMTETFHRNHPYIDIAVHGEGERIFKYILERIAIDDLGDKSMLPSISYIDGNNEFHHNPKSERMHDLSEVPSPYLTGVFDPLMTAYPDQKWIAMWETDRGCPYQCTYCDWGGAIEDKVSPFVLERVKQEAWWFGEHKIPYVFCANANFGILKQDVDIAKCLAEVKRATGFPEGISVQNSKNPKAHTLEALEILEKAGLNKATVMSIQSKNRETLKAVRRENMRTEEYQGIQKRLRTQGVFTMTDYIIPMPIETYESVLDGVSEIITDGQYDRIQFNNLSRLPNAEMGDPEYLEAYGMEIIRTKIVNYHGKKNDSISGVEEYQQLVIATNTMPREEWVKTRSFCHLVSLLFFDKLLQIPIITLCEIYQIPYRRIWEKIMDKVHQPKEFPIFSEIFSFFEKHARDMQNGIQEEMSHSPEWLDIWWYPDEYIFIQLCRENKLADFYKESEKLLESCLESSESADILSDSIKLNQALIKLPFRVSDLELTLSCNIWEFYKAIMVGEMISIVKGDHKYIIDRTTKTSSANTNARWDSWEEWYERMVWWCNRRGAYLYGNINPHKELAGHH